MRRLLSCHQKAIHRAGDRFISQLVTHVERYAGAITESIADEKGITARIFPGSYTSGACSGFFSTGLRNILKPRESHTLFFQVCGPTYLPDAFSVVDGKVTALCECKLVKDNGDGSVVRNAFGQLLDYMLAFGVSKGVVLLYDFTDRFAVPSDLTSKYVNRFSRLARSFGLKILFMRLTRNLNVEKVRCCVK